ncbi:MAG: glycosyltransferase family 4 protein [Phycisphaerae bacterium]
MRVAMDDRPLHKTLTGVGNYIAQLLLHVPTVASDVQFEPFLCKNVKRIAWQAVLDKHAAASSAPRVALATSTTTSKPTHPERRPPAWLRRIYQAGYGVAFRLATRGCDIYHEPNHVPIRSPLPTVTTIHDLSGIIHPEWHPADRVAWYERGFARGVRQTSVFLAASEFTKREMITHLSIPADRIVVSYQAARDAFRPLADGEREATRARLALPARFMLYVGTLEPRKNVDGLLDAYGRSPAALRRACPLLIVGAWGWKAEAIRAKLADQQLASDVRLLGYLHDPDLAALYSLCTAFVWPTRYEGFGLPPLEALACGAHVIVSDVASLPEVVGDAGVLLSPDDVESWTEAMRAAVEQTGDAAAAARVRALAQAQRFSWGEFARQTVAAYRMAN